MRATGLGFMQGGTGEARRLGRPRPRGKLSCPPRDRACPIIPPFVRPTGARTDVVEPLPTLNPQASNNLTKSLSFNICDVCYASPEDERRRYIEYIDEEYNADRLTQILTDVAEIIGANILNIARQDYDPQGASVTILISEEPVIDKRD